MFICLFIDGHFYYDFHNIEADLSDIMSQPICDLRLKYDMCDEPWSWTSCSNSISSVHIWFKSIVLGRIGEWWKLQSTSYRIITIFNWESCIQAWTCSWIDDSTLCCLWMWCSFYLLVVAFVLKMFHLECIIISPHSFLFNNGSLKVFLLIIKDLLVITKVWKPYVENNS